MTHKCAFCGSPVGRRGGSVWLKVAGRRIAVCLVCAIHLVCAIQGGYVKAEVVPETPPLESFQGESREGP